MDVLHTAWCLTATSFPSFVAPSWMWLIVVGLAPTGPNIGVRSSPSFTGRFTACAAIAASTVCDHIEPFVPNPPPTQGHITCTASGSIEKIFARLDFTPLIPCVASYTLSLPPSHHAIVPCGSIGLWF